MGEKFPQIMLNGLCGVHQVFNLKLLPTDEAYF